MSELLTGSICLSNIDKKQIKKVQCKDGVERLFLNIAVIERKEPSAYGHTHFVTCAPRKEEREEGVNYIIGDLKRYGQTAAMPTPEEIASAPAAEENDLPF